LSRSRAGNGRYTRALARLLVQSDSTGCAPPEYARSDISVSTALAAVRTERRWRTVAKLDRCLTALPHQMSHRVINWEGGPHGGSRIDTGRPAAAGDAGAYHCRDAGKVNIPGRGGNSRDSAEKLTPQNKAWPSPIGALGPGGFDSCRSSRCPRGTNAPGGPAILGAGRGGDYFGKALNSPQPGPGSPQPPRGRVHLIDPLTLDVPFWKGTEYFSVISTQDS